MVKKILLLFILFNISFEQSDLNIEILGGEQSPKCANEMGRLEFSSKYTSSSEDEINSYFLLNFKDKSNKKRFSICQLSTSKNSSSSSEIDPSQPGENEYDPDDAELKSLLGNIRLKFQGRLNKLLDSREELKKLAKHSANVVNYQIVTQSEKINLQNIKNKFNGSLSGLNKLIELGSGNLTEKIANFNISEAKDKLNSSICTLKKKIVEMSGKQDLLQLLNMSKIVNGVSALLSGAKNTTELNKKVVNGIDTILTKFNLYTILSLGYLEEKMKTNLGTTNLKEAVDKIKTNLANNTKLNNLKNMSFSKINETLYDVPNIIQDKIDKKEPLIIFDKIVGYLNNSNISDSIHKMISSFEGLENIISSKNGTNVKEIFNNMLNSTKTKINSLNSTLLNNIVSKIGESNDKIIQKLKENGVPELFQNITNKLNELKNKIKDRAQNISFDEIGEIITNSIDKIKQANATEVTNKILDQIALNKKIISFLKNESEFLNKYKLNITEHLKDYIENNDQLNSLIEKIKNNNNQIKESLITPDIINEMEELKTYKDKIKQNLNDIKTEEQSKFNQTLYNLIDKLIKINYT